MKYFVTLLVIAAAAEGPKDESPGGLSIAIVPTKIESGSSIIDRGATFEVVFANKSAKPIRLWRERCQLGHGALSFRVDADKGQSPLMSKSTPDSSAWEDEPPQSLTIPPGGTFSRKVRPSGFFWGD